MCCSQFTRVCHPMAISTTFLIIIASRPQQQWWTDDLINCMWWLVRLGLTGEVLRLAGVLLASMRGGGRWASSSSHETPNLERDREAEVVFGQVMENHILENCSGWWLNIIPCAQSVFHGWRLSRPVSIPQNMTWTQANRMINRRFMNGLNWVWERMDSY